MAEFLFTMPSEDLLRRVMLDPSNVETSSWIVFVNYILLALASDRKAAPHATQTFRINVHTALNDSKIYLEPSLANIHCLMLLATHGEDFATPNLSWMTLGHACQQAQALNLHLATPQNYEEQQRLLSLFWSLFIVDKSCSLAFGRPAFLPTSNYQTVLKPDRRYVSRKYCPHLSLAKNLGTSNNTADTFASSYYYQCMEFALITGAISELLVSSEPSGSLQDLQQKLHQWHKRTQEVSLKFLA